MRFIIEIPDEKIGFTRLPEPKCSQYAAEAARMAITQVFGTQAEPFTVIIDRTEQT